MSDLVEVEVVTEDKDLLPVYASLDASGCDIKAYIEHDLVIHPGETKLISTGLRVAIPKGYEIQIRPRSGLALKHGITVLNTPGTIDSDYRGEIGVILINHGRESFTITKSMRIAQLVVARVCQAKFSLREKLFATERGVGGFGHSGTH